MKTPGEHPIRIMLVDDHDVVRAGLRMLLENCPFMRVAGEAQTRDQTLALVATERPDIILLDLDMAGSSSLAWLPDIIARAPASRVLILTGVREPEAHKAAIKAGAVGVILKDCAAEDLIRAITKVHQGESWIDRKLMAELITEFSKKSPAPEPDPEALRIASLTEREREVIASITQGLKNREIARQLHISEHTVRHHLSAIFTKLGVNDRLELVIYAYRHRLAPPA